MIVGYTANKIGDFVDFSDGVPFRGLKTITSLVDSITGTTGTKYFDKFFSYTLDGVHFTNYAPLTLGALTALNPLPIKGDTIFKFRYIRAGTDNTGTLVLNSLNVSGIYDLQYLQVLVLSNTVFSDIAITDQFFNEVWVNLLNKLYDGEIVPKYIVRGDDDLEDVDYINFWKTIAYFFSLPISLADYKITNIQNNQMLMLDYLKQQNLLVCKDETLLELNSIAEQLFDVFRRRGTQKIVLQDGTHLAPVTDAFHGEFLRYICFDIIKDEFLFEYLSRDLLGWNINVSSPCYNGLYKHLQLNKTPEQTQNFQDLSLFDITETVAIISDGSKDVAKLSNGGEIHTKQIKIDPKLSYEITFFCRQTVLAANLYLYIECYDEVGGLISLYNIDTGVVSGGGILEGIAMANTSNYYFARGILYSYDSPLLSAAESKTNLNTGVNLRFPSNAKRVVIKIVNFNDSGSEFFYIWDFKMKPLKSEYNIGGFVNSNDMTNVWLKNNNPDVSGIELERNVKNYLIPYNSMLKINQL